MNGCLIMSEKRFKMRRRIDVVSDIYDSENDKLMVLSDVVSLLNELYEENGQLRFQLKNTSVQRDEFLQGARENSEKIGELEKENEQLKREVKEKKDFLINFCKYMHIDNSSTEFFIEEFLEELCGD